MTGITFAGMNTIHGAGVYAGGVFAVDTGVGNDEGHVKLLLRMSWRAG
jgi:hypothetical protein